MGHPHQEETRRSARATRAGELLQFWQPRFYDFNMYSRKKKKEKLEYMHANPVNRGFVKHPKDWPWSSFPFYERDVTGLVTIDPVD